MGPNFYFSNHSTLTDLKIKIQVNFFLKAKTNFFVKGVFFSGFEPSLTKMPGELNFFKNNKFSEKVYKSKKKVNILTMVKGC